MSENYIYLFVYAFDKIQKKLKTSFTNIEIKIVQMIITLNLKYYNHKYSFLGETKFAGAAI